MKKRAFSVLELVLSASLLLLAMSIMFSVFRYGFQGFRMASGRNDMQADARALLARLGQDLEQSTQVGIVFDNGALRVANVPLQAGLSVQPRHLLCMPALTNWNNPSSFDNQTGLPIWDSYVLYHAGLQTANASLFRVELSAANLSGQSWPDFTSYATTYLANPAPKGTNINGATVLGRRALAGNLLGFEVSKSSKQVIVVVRLYNRAQGPLEGKQRDEILEVRARYVPKNQAF